MQISHLFPHHFFLPPAISLHIHNYYGPSHCFPQNHPLIVDCPRTHNSKTTKKKIQQIKPFGARIHVGKNMDNSLATGSVAVFSVSGSVVLLALQVHKRLLSNFMKKMEFEIGMSKKIQPKKRVRFADDAVVQPPFFGNNKAGTKRLAASGCPTRVVGEKIEDLPLNWQALYKGIMENRVLNNLKLM